MVYQYYVVEVIRNKSKEFEHNVFWLYDEDDAKARLKGESKYHEILTSAAVSEHPEHSAILFSSKGLPLMFQCYEHEEDEE
jgi:hypothetical protein